MPGASRHLYFAVKDLGATASMTSSDRDAREPSDATLLRDVALGDGGALGALYDRYAPAIRGVARRSLGDASDADDLVHTVFLTLRRIASSYDGRPSCWAWLRGITVRAAMRYRRGRGRFERMLLAYYEAKGPTSPPDPERRAAGHEQLIAFEKALASLAPQKRATYVLVELEGLSAQEAGEALDIPAATVRTRLFHARRKLLEEMAGGERRSPAQNPTQV